jgi:hypothetical protein
MLLGQPKHILVPREFGLQSPLDIFRLPPSVALALEENVLDASAFLLDALDNRFRLGRRDNNIDGALQDLEMASIGSECLAKDTTRN